MLTSVKVGLAGALACLLIGGFQELRIRSLQTENTRLSGLVQLQNSATDVAAADGRTDKAESDARALAVIAGAEAEKAQLPAGHGPEAQNQWFAEAFR